MFGKFQQSLSVRSITSTLCGSFYYSRAFHCFASQIRNTCLKFLFELALPTAKRVRPCLYGVFVNGLVIECADPAPTIVIDEIHRRFPPCPFPDHAPLQNGGHDVVPVLKNVCFNAEIFAKDPLYRIMPAVE